MIKDRCHTGGLDFRSIKLIWQTISCLQTINQNAHVKEPNRLFVQFKECACDP